MNITGFLDLAATVEQLAPGVREISLTLEERRALIREQWHELTSEQRAELEALWKEDDEARS